MRCFVSAAVVVVVVVVVVGVGSGAVRAESAAIYTAAYHSYPGTGAVASDASATSEAIAAVRFDVPPFADVIYLSLYFGPGGGADQTVDITIWDDSAATLEPGAVLATQTATITPGDSLQNLSVFWNGAAEHVRVGVTRHVAAPPAVGLDTDGISGANRNFVKRGTGPWQEASAAGLTGDWIIGLAYYNGGGGPFVDGPVDASGLPDGGTLPDAADGTSGDGDGDGDDGDGCCSTHRGATTAVIMAVAALGLLLAPRRRRSR